LPDIYVVDNLVGIPDSKLITRIDDREARTITVPSGRVRLMNAVQLHIHHLFVADYGLTPAEALLVLGIMQRAITQVTGATLIPAEQVQMMKALQGRTGHQQVI
jgi:hypothetical protein